MNSGDSTKIEALVQRALRVTGAPGAALAVVTPEGSYVQGYGVKRLGSEDAVTPETLFPIASVSKAFTATACACLVDDGKLGWDDPVRKHLPAFRLLDPAADANVTIRDLLCHRTGLPRHDSLWYRTELKRDEILARMAFLKPTASYRGLYQYSNLCFAAAGEAVAAASGMPYEEFLKSRVLEPLGLHSVTFSGPGLVATENHAWPHQKKKGKVTALDAPLDFFNVGPAGCINASVAELVGWLKFQLSGGGEGTPVSQKSLAETHTPQMIVPFDDLTRELYPDRMHQTYALGWSRFDWQGHLVLSHGGAIDGFRSHLVVCPRAGVAFVVLVNMASYFPEIVRNSLLDLLLGLKGGKNWHQVFQKQLQKDSEKARADKKAKAQKCHKNTKPSLPLASYTGTYSDPGYGTATVREESGKLHLAWEAFDVPLKHWHHDTFITDTEQPGFANLDIVFTLKASGSVATLSLFEQSLVKN
ncbi:serine hydrolase [Armatimonas sp.]|uniref:serine hydrolase n=1 Tax=Armatimonas sp. TaxID=1872638 RepID=UPI00286D5C40|nr:serine hydrolase [Armatimonas sp.]